MLSVVRYHYIPSTPKDAYMGKYGGLDKRHTITIAFPDETRYHEYIDNKIELSTLDISVSKMAEPLVICSN